MYKKDYEKLKDQWKSYFDFFALKGHKDSGVSDFRLTYNKSLFDVFFSDQECGLIRKKTEYEEIAFSLFDKASRRVFKSSDNGVLSLSSILKCIDSSEVTCGDGVIASEGLLVSDVNIQLLVPVNILSEKEKDFLSAVMPTSPVVDGDVVIKLARIPRCRKNCTVSEDEIYLWSIKKVKSRLTKAYYSMNGEGEASILKRLKGFLVDVAEKYSDRKFFARF